MKLEITQATVLTATQVLSTFMLAYFMWCLVRLNRCVQLLKLRKSIRAAARVLRDWRRARRSSTDDKPRLP